MTALHTVDTVVIGAGHAGLAVSRLLTEAGREHVVLDRGRVGERWRTRTLGLAAPAHAELDDPSARLALRRRDPDGFLSSGQLRPPARAVRRLLRGARPDRARRWSGLTTDAAGGYDVHTDHGTWRARLGRHRHRSARHAVRPRRGSSAPTSA